MSVAQIPGSAVTARVPAKINLELRVGPRRDDGYHGLSTVFHAVSVHDDVTVESAEEWGVDVLGPYAHLVPGNADNLAVRAAQMLGERVGIGSPVHVTIDKRIPVAAGLAGGSADAAGALVACEMLWGVDAGAGLLDDIAARLGSDINFALRGGTAIGCGRGEDVTPVLARGRFSWVLVADDRGLSTPSVFAECDRLREGRDVPDPQTSEELMSALRTGDPRALAGCLHNDLQEAALSLRPDLQGVLDAGLAAGALGGLVSGSGPTIAFLAQDADGAADLAEDLAAAGFAGRVLTAVGPTHGAHVVSGVQGPAVPSLPPSLPFGGRSSGGAARRSAGENGAVLRSVPDLPDDAGRGDLPGHHPAGSGRADDED